jgi:hypothetical protein
MTLNEARTIITTSPPPTGTRGECLECAGRGVCEWHAAQGRVQDHNRSEAIRSLLQHERAKERARICARFEFESDEYHTAEEKADLYKTTGTILPRY